MKSLSRILTVCLCCVPVFGAHAAPVATTAGSNLTAYNPSNANNNQWATISNARYDGNTAAKADFGNCNAVVLRCAQPKCGNGGCAKEDVAAAIVAGCVKSNDKCKQYGDDLVSYMTAQLVANSTAKINQQQAAIAQAQAAAEAQAAAAQNEQIAQMQQQMAQMQNQMAQQQAESAAALQEALAQQQAQSAAALEDMKTAATDAAKQTEAGITAYQQDAINRGISEEVLARQQVTGQIQTEIEDSETSLVAMRKAMQNSFEYAGCDARGNNCTGPKRIKKWRELARGFLTPYDNAIDKIYDALVTAQSVGVDLTDIYMMLSNSCNSWGQYMCPKGADIYYISDDNGKVSAPMSCPSKSNYANTMNRPIEYCYSSHHDDVKQQVLCYQNQGCKPCTLLKVLTDNAEVYEGWINPTVSNDDNGTVVSCASSILDNTKLFARRTKNKNGAGLVDIDLLDKWLNQVEPTPKKKTSDAESVTPTNYYCGTTNKTFLESKTLSRSINTGKSLGTGITPNTFCVTPGTTEGTWVETNDTDDCPYINPVLAICDTHPYNAGKSAILETSDEREEMKEIIGLKITVVSQQMYKQYEYLNATLRRLKTQLQKAVLTSNLQAAGAKSEDGSSSGGLVGGNSNKDKAVVLQGAINCSYQVEFDRFVDCISGNIQTITRAADSNASKKDACLQLQNDLNSVVSRLGAEGLNAKIQWTNCSGYMDKSGKVLNVNKKTCTNNDRDVIKMCANEIASMLSAAKRTINNQNRGYSVLVPNP